MSGLIQGIIADQLRAAGLIDHDRYSMRAADAVKKRGIGNTPENITTILRGTKTSVFQRNTSKKSKEEHLAQITKAIIKAMKITEPANCPPASLDVLFLAAAPKDQTRIGVDEEKRAIEEVLRGNANGDRLVFHDRWATRVEDFLRAVNEVNPDVIHFSGHGSGQSGLVFADKAGGSALLPDDLFLRILLQFQSKPKLVIMNACYSTAQARVIVQHANVVVGMDDVVDDGDAIRFAAQLYDGIASGRSVVDAIEQGKIAVDLQKYGGSQIINMIEQRPGLSDKPLLTN